MSSICERTSQTSRWTYDTVATRFDTRIDGIKDSISRGQIWALVLYIALAGGMLGVMARGFGWI